MVLDSWSNLWALTSARSSWRCRKLLISPFCILRLDKCTRGRWIYGIELFIAKLIGWGFKLMAWSSQWFVRDDVIQLISFAVCVFCLVSFLNHTRDAIQFYLVPYMWYEMKVIFKNFKLVFIWCHYIWRLFHFDVCWLPPINVVAIVKISWYNGGDSVRNCAFFIKILSKYKFEI